MGLLFALIATPIALAAPPKLDPLFPSGGARGTKVSVAVGGSIDIWPPQVWVSRAGVTAVPSEKRGTVDVTIPADAPPGVVWLRVATPGGASQARPFVIGTLPEVVEEGAALVADAGGRRGRRRRGGTASTQIDTPQVLESSQVVVNGRLDPAGDVDVFSVSLTAGQTLVADLLAHRTLGSPMDPVMQILSEDRFVLEQNDDATDLDPRIVFTAPAEGRYLVRLFTFPSEPNSTIGLTGGPLDLYRLTLTTGPFADHAWPMTVPAINPPPVRLFGWNIPEPATGTVHIDPARPEWLSLGGAFVTGGSAGDSTANSFPAPLVNHPVSTEVEPTELATPQVVNGPLTITGRIDVPGDVDAYRFNAKKGTVWTARVVSHELGSPLDPVLTIVDSTGKLLVHGDDTGGRAEKDIELAFTASVDGDYVVTVKDLHDRGGLRFVYALTIAPPEPDFALTVAAESFLITAGKPLEIPVTVDRRGGFAEPLEIVAEGLPAGITAMPAKSEPTGDSAKTVKLILTGDGAPSGPFRIIGRCPSRSRPALAATVIPRSFIPDLWANVVKP